MVAREKTAGFTGDTKFKAVDQGRAVNGERNSFPDSYVAKRFPSVVKSESNAPVQVGFVYIKFFILFYRFIISLVYIKNGLLTLLSKHAMNRACLRS